MGEKLLKAFETEQFYCSFDLTLALKMRHEKALASLFVEKLLVVQFSQCRHLPSFWEVSKMGSRDNGKGNEQEEGRKSGTGWRRGDMEGKEKEGFLK